MTILLLLETARTHGHHIRLKKSSGTAQGVVAVRHTPWTRVSSSAEAMTAADDATTWLAKDFTLEIHVGQLNGEETIIINYTFGRGHDDYTMETVLFQAMYFYPAPKNSRPRLALCGCVLDEESEEMNMKMRA